MLASSLTGWLWFQFGADMAFGVTAAIALVVAIYFVFMINYPVVVEK